MSFPCRDVEIFRDTALHTNPVALAISRERSAEIVLPATQQFVHDALRRLIERPTALSIIIIHSLV